MSESDEEVTIRLTTGPGGLREAMGDNPQEWPRLRAVDPPQSSTSRALNATDYLVLKGGARLAAAIHPWDDIRESLACLLARLDEEDKDASLWSTP